MYCFKCGFNNPDGLEFCLNCNSQLTKTLRIVGDAAGFWKRFAANLIDLVILFPVSSIISIPFISILPTGRRARPTDILFFGEPRNDVMSPLAKFYISMTISMFILFIISWIYFVVLERSAKQASIGKRAMKLAVTDMDGDRVGLLRVNMRFFIKSIFNVLIIVGLPATLGLLSLGVITCYAMAGFTKNKLALHDIITRTRVINRAF